jgi:hypothetical protein
MSARSAITTAPRALSTPLSHGPMPVAVGFALPFVADYRLFVNQIAI